MRKSMDSRAKQGKIPAKGNVEAGGVDHGRTVVPGIQLLAEKHVSTDRLSCLLETPLMNGGERRRQRARRPV